MDHEALALLNDTALELDAQIRSLEQLGVHLSDKIGENALVVLVELRDGYYDRDEEYEIRISLGYHERKLLWAWARLAKLKQLRRDVAHGAMKNIIGNFNE